MDINTLFLSVKAALIYKIYAGLLVLGSSKSTALYVGFMSFKRLGKGAEAGNYYSDSAGLDDAEGRGVDDYYTQADGHEPAGKWFDPAGIMQGIAHGNEVDKAAFKNLLAGRSVAGEPLTQTIDDEHTAGYDVTFSVPKSVSSIWAVANEAQRKVIEAAMAKANEQAMQFLSDHAGITRRGKGGKDDEHIQLIAATWPHSSSRNGDPQKHYHNTVFNLCQRKDGSFGTIESEHLMQWQTAAGAHFRAMVAHELHKEFPGMQFDKVDGGSFDIQGVTPEILEKWSSRKNEIDDAVAEAGVSGTAGERDVLWAETRVNKTFDESPPDMQTRWLEEAYEHGFVLENALKQGELNPIVDDGKWREAGVKLTRNESLFTEQALYRYVAEQSVGASAKEIVRRMDEVKKDMVEMGVDQRGRPIYSTIDMIKVEMSLKSHAQLLHKDGKHGVDPAIVDRFIAEKKTMSGEQQAAVRHACSPGSMKIIEGSAGAGKSFSLDAVRQAFEAEGYTMQGLALSHQAARVLKESANIDSRAITGYLMDVESGKIKLDSKTVIVVDENGLVGSEYANKLLKLVHEHGAKLVLTGDEKQLNPVSAGPAMKLLKEVAGSVVIEEIRRQKEQWQREMVADFKEGRAEKAVDALIDHGKVSFHADNGATIKAMANDYYDYIKANPSKRALALAGSNPDTMALNLAIRELKRADGLIAPKDQDVMIKTASGNLPFAVGDAVMFRQNDKKLDVINRTTAVIEDIKPKGTGFEITVNIAGRKAIVNTHNYVDDKGRLPMHHADGMTIYSSQGETVDKTFVMHSGQIDRRLAYVGFSRHKEETKLYIDADAQRLNMLEKLDGDSRQGFRPTETEMLDSIKRQYYKQSTKPSTQDYVDNIDPSLRKALQTSVNDRMRTTMAIRPTLTGKTHKDHLVDDELKTLNANAALAEAMKALKMAMEQGVVLK